MKILVVCGASLLRGSGIEKFVENLVLGFQEPEIHFTIIYPYFDSVEAKWEPGTSDRVNLIPVFIPIPPMWRWAAQIRTFLFNLFVVIFYLFHYSRFDIIHTNGEKGTFSLFLGRNHSVFTIHGYALESSRRIRNQLKAVAKFGELMGAVTVAFQEKISYRLARSSVAVSQMSAELFTKWKPQFKPKVVPIGVSDGYKSSKSRIEVASKYGFDPHNLLLLWIGTNPIRKGLPISLNAINQLKNVDLVVIGTGYIPQVPNNVHLLGRVEQDELFDLYSSADALFFPSLYEAMSLTVLEALSYGLPILGFKVDFMTEILGSDYPLLVERSDQFPERIIRMRDDLTYRKNIVSISKEISLKYTREKMCLAYRDIYLRNLNEIN